MECIKSSIFLIFLLSWPCFVHAENRDQQRKLFWQARQLLMTQHYRQFAALQVHLKDYPLYPYLIFIKLKQQLPTEDRAEINDFLQTYSDTPLAPKLRADWLAYLAKKQDWLHFIHYYQPIYGTTLQCHYLHSLLARTSARWPRVPESPALPRRARARAPTLA